MKTTDLILERKNYQGYIWYSDSTVPQIIDGDFSLEVSADRNPFIAEAFLVDLDDSISISVKFIDGIYMVNSFKLAEKDFSDCRKYGSKCMQGRKLCFNQRWRKEKDDLCCGMETFVPGEMVFVGFDKDEQL